MTDNHPDPDTTWPAWLAQTKAELSPDQIADAETVLAPAFTALLHEPPPIRVAQRQLVRTLISAAAGRDEMGISHPLSPRRLAVLLMADPGGDGTPLRCPACADKVYTYDTGRYDPLTAGADGLPCVDCLAKMPPAKAIKARPSQARAQVTRRKPRRRTTQEPS
jgi:hypothetical protein